MSSLAVRLCYICYRLGRKRKYLWRSLSSRGAGSHVSSFFPGCLQRSLLSLLLGPWWGQGAGEPSQSYRSKLDRKLHWRALSTVSRLPMKWWNTVWHIAWLSYSQSMPLARRKGGYNGYASGPKCVLLVYMPLRPWSDPGCHVGTRCFPCNTPRSANYRAAIWSWFVAAGFSVVVKAVYHLCCFLSTLGWRQTGACHGNINTLHRPTDLLK